MTVTDEMIEAAARALVASYRDIWPKAGFPALREAKEMSRAALEAALSRLPASSGTGVKVAELSEEVRATIEAERREMEK